MYVKPHLTAFLKLTKGIYYFAIHPDIWPFYLSILAPQLAITLVIYMMMYIMFYPVQAVLSSFLYGPSGFVTAWFSVLQQSGMVAGFIVVVVLMPEIQKVAFDATLSREYTDDVVLLGKLRRLQSVPFLVKFGQKILELPRILIVPFILFKTFVMLLIGSIPVIGAFLVIILQAPSKGLRCHLRYFALKGYDKRQIRSIYNSKRGHYMGFGIAANFLESIPIFSVFFMFTNNIGAAIWAIDIEKEVKIQNK